MVGFPDRYSVPSSPLSHLCKTALVLDNQSTTPQTSSAVAVEIVMTRRKDYSTGLLFVYSLDAREATSVHVQRNEGGVLKLGIPAVPALDRRTQHCKHCPDAGTSELDRTAVARMYLAQSQKDEEGYDVRKGGPLTQNQVVAKSS